MRKICYENKVVAISGASSGIGAEIAAELIKRGCRIYAIARNEERLKAKQNELGDSYIPYSMDASSKDAWKCFAAYLEQKGEKLDVLINCAGYLPEFKSTDKTEVEEIEKVIATNFLSCVYSCGYLLKMINKNGAIVNIASAAALCSFAGIGAYSASKSALESYSTGISCEQKDISVTCVFPGFVRTEIMKNQDINEKETKIVRFFSADTVRVAKRIVKGAKKRKRRIIIGKDAHLINTLNKFFPRITPRIVTAVLRKSKMKLFSKI